MTNKTLFLGLLGEQHTAHYLSNQGFTILASNYHIVGGEIDLIATDGTILAFIEVKTRSYHLCEPTSLISLSKQKKIIKAAYTFIAKHNLIDKVYRFDVAFITHTYGTLKLEYIENAFTDQQG